MRMRNKALPVHVAALRSCVAMPQYAKAVENETAAELSGMGGAPPALGRTPNTCCVCDRRCCRRRPGNTHAAMSGTGATAGAAAAPTHHDRWRY